MKTILASSIALLAILFIQPSEASKPFDKWITTQTGYRVVTGGSPLDPVIPNEYAVCKLNQDSGGCLLILEYGTASTDVGYSDATAHQITLPYLASYTGVNPIYLQSADGTPPTNANGRILFTAGSNIATAYPGLNTTSWQISTGTKISRYTINGSYEIQPYSSTQLRRNIIFEGTSISNFDGSANQNGFSIPLGTFNGLTAGNKLCFNCLAKGNSRIVNYVSRFTDKMQYLLESTAVPHIVFVEAPTNDIANRTDGATAIYNEWKAYVDTLYAHGATVIASTMIARIQTSCTNTNAETDRLAFNTLLRADSDFTGKYVDWGADSHFDSQADCTNMTYYLDGTHPATTGQAILYGLSITVINSNL